ncbi:MAG: putative zinc-binding metallopeptidase [bacterium]|nr:putative zinc-binding metallopeptidase [bacterium]
MNISPVFGVSASDIYVWAFIFIILLFPLYGLFIFFNRYVHHKAKHNGKKHDYKHIDIDMFAHAHHKGEFAHHFEGKWYESRVITRVIPLALVFLLMVWLLVAMIRENTQNSYGYKEKNIIAQREINKQQQQPKEDKKEESTQAGPTYTAPSAPLRFGDIGFISQLQAANNIGEAEAALQSFLDYYGLDMQLTNITKTTYEESGNFKFTRPANKHLSSIKTYGSMFMDEWAKYPPDFIKASRLNSVAFVVGLQVDYGNGHRDVAATYDVLSDIMMYDVSYGASLYSEQVVHHEFNHLFEYNQNNTYTRPDPSFTQCNPVAYGSGGASAYEDGNYSYTQHPNNGFVTTYAKTAIEEDRAELFGYLMQEDNYASLISWNKSDSCLAKKTGIYQKYIRSLAPTMTDSYYDAIN